MAALVIHTNLKKTVVKRVQMSKVKAVRQST